MVIFRIISLLKKKCPYIQWISLFSLLESILSFYMLQEGILLVGIFCVCCLFVLFCFFFVFFFVVRSWLFVGWLVGFYGISISVGHSTSNSVYIYIHIQPKISKRILRYVEVSISRIASVCTRLTSFKLSYFLVNLWLFQEGENVINFDVFEQIG